MAVEKIRIQKYLSECGYTSRRKADELVAQGKVKINGHLAQVGDKINPKTDTITVFGKRVRNESSRKLYIMLHKPRGYVTTLSDERGRKCVTDLINGIHERIYPIGRLDMDSEGLILLTNDGDFSNAVMHPTHQIGKHYRVTVKPDITDNQIAQLESGIEIDGRVTAPAVVRLLEKTEGRAVLEVILYEGRNRQIRKMCEALGLEVARLKRTAIGSLRLGMLPCGSWRELKTEEVEKLYNAATRPVSNKEE